MNSIELPTIGALIALIGALLAGAITYLFMWKAKAKGKQLTSRGKYIYPILTIMGVSLVPGFGIFLMLFPQEPSNLAYRDWLLFLILPVLTTGFVVVMLIASYLVNIWRYQHDLEDHKND